MRRDCPASELPGYTGTNSCSTEPTVAWTPTQGVPIKKMKELYIQLASIQADTSSELEEERATCTQILHYIQLKKQLY